MLLAVELSTQIFVNPIYLQIAVIGTMEHDNIQFLVLYNSFISLCGYAISHPDMAVFNLLVGTFLIYVGLSSSITDYLKIRRFSIRKVFFNALAIIPIAIVVFSALSGFKVLRIL